MHAYLVIGGSEAERAAYISDRLSKLNIADFDQVVAGDTEGGIGIADIRAFIRRLNLAPQYSDRTAGIIRNGYRLTTDAQQALLKTLEEPPAHATIIIESTVIGNLLATVVSRCNVTRLADSYTLPDERMAAVVSVLKDAAGDLSAADLHAGELASGREAAAAFVSDTLRAIHILLVQAGSVQSADGKTALPATLLTAFGRRFLTAKRQLDVNVSPGLVLSKALRIS